ncbi:MAG: hypothetical protein QOE41_1121 [Mycobacterium sp.]|jgi:hypothetical protein|nr:hypothetical protein [Mycobacterium sp.]MDT5131810.1 hypothetical protein [Mycobacterium sp.]
MYGSSYMGATHGVAAGAAHPSAVILPTIS